MKIISHSVLKGCIFLILLQKQFMVVIGKWENTVKIKRKFKSPDIYHPEIITVNSLAYILFYYVYICTRIIIYLYFKNIFFKPKQNSWCASTGDFLVLEEKTHWLDKLRFPFILTGICFIGCQIQTSLWMMSKCVWVSIKLVAFCVFKAKILDLGLSLKSEIWRLRNIEVYIWLKYILIEVVSWLETI